jgi:TonB family protein
MKVHRLMLLFVVLFFILSLGSFAGTGLVGSSDVVSRVAPAYPEIAKKMGITGIVEVLIQVDDQGKVTKAAAQTGPAMLRASAEAAVMQWKFKPSAGEGKVAVNFSK